MTEFKRIWRARNKSNLKQSSTILETEVNGKIYSIRRYRGKWRFSDGFALIAEGNLKKVKEAFEEWIKDQPDLIPDTSEIVELSPPTFAQKTCFGAIATTGAKQGKLVMVISFVDDPDGMKEAILDFFKEAIKHKCKIVLLTDAEARSGWGRNPDQPELFS